jgi:hypothetical protein
MKISSASLLGFSMERVKRQSHSICFRYKTELHASYGLSGTDIRTTGSHVSLGSVRVKVKRTLVQALRLCTGRAAHKGSKGIVVLYRH